jgi:hypothetical protein
VDVDAAKQAALSALAGLDMTTTKANLDASKAAAATARANGEVPTHVRKPSMRSVSCRQLGTGSAAAPGEGGAAGGVGKTVAFDEAAGASKPRVAADSQQAAAPKAVQWRAGAPAVDASQQRRVPRAPASRAISLPHVLQGRAGMANRLAASYAQDAALQQQLQLLHGGTHPGGAPLLPGMAALHAGGRVHQMDVLSMYQLQQAAAAAGGGMAGTHLLAQRGAGGSLLGAADDSVLHMGSGGVLLQGQQAQLLQQGQPQLPAANWQQQVAAQQQQQQQQQALWQTAGTGQMTVHAPGANAALAGGQQQQQQQQLLAQLQAGGMAVGGGADGVWMQPPVAASAALQQQQVGGGLAAPAAPGMLASTQQAGLLGSRMQQQPGASGARPDGGDAVVFQELLEQYQQASWMVLAAAQRAQGTRNQLLTELVLQLTMLHTLNGVLQSTLAPGAALNDFSYLSGAARRHMATFNRLSAAGDISVRLLALIAPLACRHASSTGGRAACAVHAPVCGCLGAQGAGRERGYVSCERPAPPYRH